MIPSHLKWRIFWVLRAIFVENSLLVFLSRSESKSVPVDHGSRELWFFVINICTLISTLTQVTVVKMGKTSVNTGWGIPHNSSETWGPKKQKKKNWIPLIRVIICVFFERWFAQDLQCWSWHYFKVKVVISEENRNYILKKLTKLIWV